MLIEHVAFMVAEPEAVAKWYCEHLGLQEVRKGGGGDIFIGDDSGQVVLQLEDARLLEGKAPGHGNQHPGVLHMAFSTGDVAGTRERLLAAGATAYDEVVVTPDGDEMTTLRDPWGLPFQLVKRKDPLRVSG